MRLDVESVTLYRGDINKVKESLPIRDEERLVTCPNCKTKVRILKRFGEPITYAKCELCEADIRVHFVLKPVE